MSFVVGTSRIFGRAGTIDHDYKSSSTVYHPDIPAEGCDEYSSVKVLQSSSEAEVHVAYLKRTQKYCIVKQIYPPAISRAQGLHREVTLLTRLNADMRHRNIVQMWEAVAVREDCRVDIYEEHCDGGDLRHQINHWIRTFGIFPTPAVLYSHAFIQLINGLAFLHHGLHHRSNFDWDVVDGHRPIIHGDLKPENILLRWSGNPEVNGLPDFVITDFGAGFLESDCKPCHYLGTRGYIPPEVTSNCGLKDLKMSDYDAAGNIIGPIERDRIYAASYTTLTTSVDIYTFGLVMAELLTGVQVEAGTDPIDVLVDHDKDDDALVNCLAWVHGCLEKDPARRQVIMNVPMSDMGPMLQPRHTLLTAVYHMTARRDHMLQQEDLMPQLEWWASPPGAAYQELEPPAIVNEPDHDLTANWEGSMSWD